MGDVGDGDPDDMTALVVGGVVGMGEDGVVAVARVGRVDGDEGQVAQILAALETCGFHGVGLGDGVVGELVGDAVLVDRDERHRARLGRVAEPGDDAGRGQAEAVARAGLFGLDQLAVPGAVGGAGGDAPFAVGALVDGQDAPALGALAEDAEDLSRIGADLADQAPLVAVGVGAHLGEAGEDAVALAQRGIGLARDEEDAGLGPLAVPFERAARRGRRRRRGRAPAGRRRAAGFRGRGRSCGAFRDARRRPARAGRVSARCGRRP